MGQWGGTRPIDEMSPDRGYIVKKPWNNKIYYSWDPCCGPQLQHIRRAGRVTLHISHVLLPQKDAGWTRITKMQPFIHRACPLRRTLQSTASEARAETLPDFLASAFPSGRKQTKPIKMQTSPWKAREKGDAVTASQAQNCIALIFLSNAKSTTRFSLSFQKMMKPWVHNERCTCVHRITPLTSKPIQQQVGLQRGTGVFQIHLSPPFPCPSTFPDIKNQ